MYGQLISLLNKSKILKISREKGGERYVKHFDAWQHLVIMLYAVIKRFDSLREITDSMFPEARKFSHELTLEVFADFTGARAKGVHADDLVGHALCQYRLTLAHRLRVKTAVPVTGRLNRHLTILRLYSLRHLAVAAVA